ncbi:hypothetical protein SAMN04489801_4617 [Pseudomonas mandelii]|uniref:Lysis protein n=1 Tax=Pseudomonas mandelii TaxID=75612 RepID=A0ABY0VV98_9PSED|nr:hypothetical protein SAMN04489801_4617 [Pseudomonas mandelii]
MSPAAWKLVGILLLVLATAGVTWKVQDWRYGKQRAEQAGLHQDDLTAVSNAAADQMRANQDKRLAIEQRLSASDETHHKELKDAQTNQARLRDRLATSDLRLSVLLAEDPGSGDPVLAGTAAVGVFMEARASDLTQRMLNELSESPTRATKD